jgi:hypothetical protein
METTEVKTPAEAPPAPASCIEHSETPIASVVLEWSNGRHVLALPISYIASCEWMNLDGGEAQTEEVTIECGSRIVVARGSGLRGLPAELTRGQVTTIREILPEHAETQKGMVVTGIEVKEVEKKGGAD